MLPTAVGHTSSSAVHFDILGFEDTFAPLKLDVLRGVVLICLPLCGDKRMHAEGPKPVVEQQGALVFQIRYVTNQHPHSSV